MLFKQHRRLLSFCSWLCHGWPTCGSRAACGLRIRMRNAQSAVRKIRSRKILTKSKIRKIRRKIQKSVAKSAKKKIAKKNQKKNPSSQKKIRHKIRMRSRKILASRILLYVVLCSNTGRNVALGLWPVVHPWTTLFLTETNQKSIMGLVD